MPIVEYLSYILANKSWNYMDNMIEKGQEKKTFFESSFSTQKRRKRRCRGKTCQKDKMCEVEIASSFKARESDRVCVCVCLGGCVGSWVGEW